MVAREATPAILFCSDVNIESFLVRDIRGAIPRSVRVIVRENGFVVKGDDA